MRPVDPVTTRVDIDWVADAVDDQTVALVGSACNYGYGTVDPIDALSDIALEHGIGLHVDGCLGGWILPFGQELGYDIPVFDYRVPGVTSISADTHKYGYAFKGTSVLTFRDQGAAQRPVLLQHRLERRASTARRGWRARARAACWPPPGPRWSSSAAPATGATPSRSSRRRPPCRRRCAATPSSASWASPTFLFSFTSDEFDIYHVNDFLRTRGWRLNGQQYPNALHMAVTRPQTAPGVADAFATDLADAVAYAIEHAAEAPASGAVYGGVAGGMTDEADEFIRMVMGQMMDAQQALPVDA